MPSGLQRLSNAANARLARLFPERRLIIRSETRADYLRLSPLAQGMAAVGVAALAAWTGYASFTHFTGAAREAEAERLLAAATGVYERRLGQAERERMAMADALSSARAEAERATAALSQRAVALADAEAAQARISGELAAVREQLSGIAAKHGDTARRYEETSARLEWLQAALDGADGAKAEMEAEIADLTTALERLSAERNDAAIAKKALTHRVAELQTEFARRRDQQERIYSRIEDAARMSLDALEAVFKRSGVDLDQLLANVRRDHGGAGGPFEPVTEAGFADEDEDARLTTLLSELETVNAMRIAVERLPYARPVRYGRFTSGFGRRLDPMTGKRAKHDGVDLAAPLGTPVYATGAGRVIYSGKQRGYGNVIKIRHAFGYETVYAHLKRRRVKVGDIVERGDRIGDMGNTGRSTGSHLHYEIRANGRPVNPAKYIEAARDVL